MIRASIVAAFVLGAGAWPVWAQDPDTATLKEEILKKVRERIQKEHKEILERLSKILDEELGKSAAPKPPAPPKPDPELAKKMQEIEKRLRALDEQKEELLAQMRILKREAEEAPLREEAKKKWTEGDEEEVREFFREALELHNNKEFRKSIRAFKLIYYAFPRSGLGVASAYNVACGHALSGEKEAALDWLELSIRQGYNDFDHIRQDSDLDSLRKEKRYQKLMLDR